MKRKKYCFFVSEGKGKYVSSFVSEEFSKTLDILKNVPPFEPVISHALSYLKEVSISVGKDLATKSGMKH